MASENKRRRRRLRRAARVRKYEVKRYTIYCGVDEKDKPIRHYVYVTTEGAIFFKNHTGLSFSEMAAEGCLAYSSRVFNVSPIDNCFRIAARVSGNYSEEVLKRLDSNSASEGLCKLLRDLDDKRRRRKEMAEDLQKCQMIPIRESLVYRRELLLARFVYRVDSLVYRLQKRLGLSGMEVNKGMADKAYTFSSFGYRPNWGFRNSWDY